MHPEVESYLVIQSLSKDKTKVIEKKGKEYVASNIDSMMLYKKAVIISDDWFLLHVHSRFLKQIIRLLRKCGVKDIDISHFNEGVCYKVFVTQDPNIFIPQLMQFEEFIEEQKSKEN